MFWIDHCQFAAHAYHAMVGSSLSFRPFDEVKGQDPTSECGCPNAKGQHPTLITGVHKVPRFQLLEHALRLQFRDSSEVAVSHRFPTRERRAEAERGKGRRGEARRCLRRPVDEPRIQNA